MVSGGFGAVVAGRQYRVKKNLKKLDTRYPNILSYNCGCERCALARAGLRSEEVFFLREAGYGTVLTAMALTVAAVALLLAASGGWARGVCTPGPGCFARRVRRAAEYTPVFHKTYNVFSSIYTKLCEGHLRVTSYESMGYSAHTPPPPSNI
jgi:hypothetical protein